MTTNNIAQINLELTAKVKRLTQEVYDMQEVILLMRNTIGELSSVVYFFRLREPETSMLHW